MCTFILYISLISSRRIPAKVSGCLSLAGAKMVIQTLPHTWITVSFGPRSFQEQLSRCSTILRLTFRVGLLKGSRLIGDNYVFVVSTIPKSLPARVSRDRVFSTSETIELEKNREVILNLMNPRISCASTKEGENLPKNETEIR